jgi:hypothetical protein
VSRIDPPNRSSGSQKVLSGVQEVEFEPPHVGSYEVLGEDIHAGRRLGNGLRYCGSHIIFLLQFRSYMELSTDKNPVPSVTLAAPSELLV